MLGDFSELLHRCGVSPHSSMNGPQEQVTDEQAMWRVQRHDDHGAFTVLVQRWQAPLRRLAVRMLADEHRAEDITQDTFSRVFAHRQDYRPEHRFSTWLWRITLNLCHDELRRRQRRPESPLDAPPDSLEDGPANGVAGSAAWAASSASPDEHAALADTAGRVRQALQELPELYRSVVILRHYEGLKFSEIAVVLGIPEGTVKSRMVEGLARLAKSLGPLLSDRTPVVGLHSSPSTSPVSRPIPVDPPGTHLVPALLSP